MIIDEIPRIYGHLLQKTGVEIAEVRSKVDDLKNKISLNLSSPL